MLYKERLVQLKGGEREAKIFFKAWAAQNEHWHSSQIHNKHLQMLKDPHIESAVLFTTWNRILKVFI